MKIYCFIFLTDMTSEAKENASEKIASEEFVHALTSQMSRESLDSLIGMQRDAYVQSRIWLEFERIGQKMCYVFIFSLSRFEKTNEMLTNCCTLSSGRLNSARKDLTLYGIMIMDMKKDLDSIFRRLR